MANDIKWPFGIGETEVLTATGAQPITIVDNFTLIDGVATEATADRTIDLTVDPEIGIGARISLKTKTNGTEDTIFGTAITAPTVTGVAGKTFSQGFTYDGAAFLSDGTAVQID